MDIKTFRRATPSSVDRSGKIRSFLTYQLTMALHVETSWCPYQLFHRTFSIDLTASAVSCQSCVEYTTFVRIVSCRLPHLNWITKNLKMRIRCSKAFCLLTASSYAKMKFRGSHSENLRNTVRISGAKNCFWLYAIHYWGCDLAESVCKFTRKTCKVLYM